MTDAIGAFSLTGLDGTAYPPTVGSLPQVTFTAFLGAVLSRAHNRGVDVDEFVIDFMDAIESEAATHPTS
jgi:hypothetical protein